MHQGRKHGGAPQPHPVAEPDGSRGHIRRRQHLARPAEPGERRRRRRRLRGALGIGEGNGRARPRRCAGAGAGQHPAERLTVVADQPPPFALAVDEADAVAFGNFAMGCQRRISGLSAAERGAPRQPLGHGAERVEHFGAHLRRRRRLEEERHVADAERFHPGRVAHEVDDGAQRGRLGLADAVGAHLGGAHVPGALAPVVPHLQEAAALAAHLQPVAAPQLRLRRRAVVGGGAQHRRVLDDDGGGQHQRQHQSPSTSAVSGLSSCTPRAACPSSAPAMNPPAWGGAMITWILSDSLSASVF